MSYKPERALTRQHCVKRQVIHIWGRNELQAREGIDTILAESHEGKHALCRNELQAREGIDTYHHDRFRQILYPGSRNELQAREGIDTRHCGITLISFDHDVEMSYKPERALTQFT